MEHTLKIQQGYLDNLVSGIKKCEIRFNDRDFQKGDYLKFWNKEKSSHSFFRVTHIHSGIGMRDGYVALSIIEIRE